MHWVVWMVFSIRVLILMLTLCKRTPVAHTGHIHFNEHTGLPSGGQWGSSVYLPKVPCGIGILVSSCFADLCAQSLWGKHAPVFSHKEGSSLQAKWHLVSGNGA